MRRSLSQILNTTYIFLQCATIYEGRGAMAVESRPWNSEVWGSIPRLGSRRSSLISIEHAELLRSTPSLVLCCAWLSALASPRGNGWVRTPPPPTSAPAYLADYCTSTSLVPGRSALRSAAHGDIVVPSHRTDWGLRSFAVAGPSSWNALPVDLRSSSFGLDTFAKHLKTHLFGLAYSRQSTHF